MGCAANFNNKIKRVNTENDENKFYYIINSNKFKYSNTNITNNEKINESNKINFINHSELNIEKI